MGFPSSWILKDWHNYARCACEEWPEQLFETPTKKGLNPLVRELCQNCPVRYECVLQGLKSEFLSDRIYGGLTPDERKRLKQTVDFENFLDGQGFGIISWLKYMEILYE